MNISDLNLKSFASKSHIFLGCSYMARKPEEEVGASNVGERIAKSDMAPVNNTPITTRGNNDVRGVKVTVTECLAARHRLQSHVKIIARFFRKSRGRNLLVELISKITHALGSFGEDFALNGDELL